MGPVFKILILLNPHHHNVSCSKYHSRLDNNSPHSHFNHQNFHHSFIKPIVKWTFLFFDCSPPKACFSGVSVEIADFVKRILFVPFLGDALEKKTICFRAEINMLYTLYICNNNRFWQITTPDDTNWSKICLSLIKSNL